MANQKKPSNLKNKILNRDALLPVLARTAQEIPAPALGGVVLARPMGVLEASNLPEDLTLNTALIIQCLVDEDGRPLFTIEDKDMIDDAPYGFWHPIMDRLLAMNGFTNDALASAEKNSQTTTPSGSSSA